MKIWSEYTLCNSPCANRCGTQRYTARFLRSMTRKVGYNYVVLSNAIITLIVLHINFIFLLIHHQCICFVSTINNNGTNRSRTQFYIIRICVFLYVLFIQISGIQYRFYIYLFSFYMLLFRIFRKNIAFMKISLWSIMLCLRIFYFIFYIFGIKNQLLYKNISK